MIRRTIFVSNSASTVQLLLYKSTNTRMQVHRNKQQQQQRQQKLLKLESTHRQSSQPVSKICHSDPQNFIYTNIYNIYTRCSHYLDVTCNDISFLQMEKTRIIFFNKQTCFVESLKLRSNEGNS